ncbi:MAG TPA: phytanoyl-CoA dioxygenase family protein [Acidimicrobiales bacterium]|nr:phytanoyl-CoA dioxygenase family protein [Acidimicrobiales bacterium]
MTTTSATGLLAELDRVGFAVIPDALTPEGVDRVRRALEPHLASGPAGRNDFEGFSTQRVYSLVVKSRAFDELILDRRVLDVADTVLGAGFLLTATLAINIGPGETAQSMHFDDGFYRIPRPRPPVSLSTLWAIDDFTPENGATLIIPGSHKWRDTPPAGEEETVTATMPSGSALVYYGTLVHAGGANRTDRHRLGVSIQYCTAWARQQENFTLAFGVEGARALPERLLELIGYSIHPPFMGMIDGRHPRKLLDR